MSREKYIRQLQLEIERLESELHILEKLEDEGIIANNSIVNINGSMKNVKLNGTRVRSKSTIKEQIEGLKKAVKLLEDEDKKDKKN